MTSTQTGSCLCGAIRYTISVPVTELRACHCTHCQKASGAAGSVNAVVPGASFNITQGAPKRYAATAESGRTLYRYFSVATAARRSTATALRPLKRWWSGLERWTIPPP